MYKRKKIVRVRETGRGRKVERQEKDIQEKERKRDEEK